MASSIITNNTHSRWDYLSSDIKNQLSFLDPNGEFVVCQCCDIFGRVSDKSVKNPGKEYGKVTLRCPYSVTNCWNDHTTTKKHLASAEKYQQMMDDKKEPDPKKRKNPIPSAIASPTITYFFTRKKKKHSNTNIEPSNGTIVPHATSKPLPLYYTKCSGIFSIREVMGTAVRFSGRRKDLLQTGLKIKQKYFLPNESFHVHDVPGTDGILNLFAMVSINKIIILVLFLTT